MRQATLVVEVLTGITFLKNIARNKYFILFDPIIFFKEQA